MTDYVFYPVTGDGLSSGTAYTWNPGTINFATPTDWTSVTSFSTLTIGTTATTGTVPGSGANVGLIAGAIAPGAFALYNPNPASGDPFIASNVYPVDVLLNSGSVALGNLLLAGFNTYANLSFVGLGSAPAQLPTLDIEGATLTVGGSILDSGSVTFPAINTPIGPINSAAATGGGTIDLGQGASIDIAGTVAAAIDFHFNDGSGNVLEIDGDSKLTPAAFAGTITGYTPGDTILLPNVPADVSGVATTGSYDITTGVLSITVGDPVTIDLNIPGFASSSGPVALTAVGNGIEVVVCFLAGTRIATVSGEVPVEELTIGDRVRTASGRTRPIVWIGTGRVMAARGRRSAATPVIVRKGALSDNVPARDLRVTKGHSLFIDDVLIPVEFLVNHRTILWDDHANEVTIYHVELETHDVLVANGAPAESYRDDGNRWLFQNANAGWTLPPQPPCAPVLTGGPVVDAAWRRLLERAGPLRGLPLTGNADLHLVVDGERVDAIERRDDMHVFRLNTRPHAVQIRSRAAVPQELGLARDARSLGVALRQIVLAQPRRRSTIDADAASLIDGYHAFEPDNGIRWTDGSATVPADLFTGMSGPCMLMLKLGGSTQYLDDGESARAAA
ncbi:MAG TPA: Hint domain-containing protein [Acetobacteraceae bacterium]